MTKLDIANALQGLSKYFDKELEFVLTGTVGLAIHGLLPNGYEPENVDIIIPIPAEDGDRIADIVDEKLSKLEALSGMKPNDGYKERVYTFKVGDIKVNAFMCAASKVDSFSMKFVSEDVSLDLRLHRANQILERKLALRRAKDYEFASDLSRGLFSLLKQ